MQLLEVTIRKRRQALEMAQAELAQRLGVTQQTVSRWEHGTAVPPPRRLVRLAEVLDLELDRLLAYAGYLTGLSGEPAAGHLRAVHDHLFELDDDELLRLMDACWDELRSRIARSPADEIPGASAT
ncbi:MAG: helix-turn-helix transcriptional regulator [Actinomycetota bacterium]|nr:helix-turn-helix transcriptional regulator [Actinomycetota bacterium]